HLLPLLIPPTPRSTLFPYTTLFRSPASMASLPSMRMEMKPMLPLWPWCAPSILTCIAESGAHGECQPSYRSLLPGCVETSVEARSEEHTSELQSRGHLVCRLLLEKK